MASSGCMEQQPSGSSHHSTYATFRTIKSSSAVLGDSAKQLGNNADYPNVITNPNSRGSSVVSAIIRSSSFISAEEEAHRMLRASQQHAAELSIARTGMIISSPADHQQRLVAAMAPSVPVPASFSEHLLSLDHADSLLMTSSSSSVEPQQLVHASLPPLPPQSSYANGVGAESQRSLVSNSSSAGYHSSSSSTSVSTGGGVTLTHRSAHRGLVSADDISPPPSSASSASSSSGVTASRQLNVENTNQEFFIVKPPPLPSSSPTNSCSANGNSMAPSVYVPRCSSAHTALAAIDEELPSLQQNEIAQVDIFYRSLKTDVRVASCMAQMFVEESVGSRSTDDQDHVACGIPLFLVDKFPTNAPSSSKKGRSNLSTQLGKQAIYLILAERGTGFTLRRERITQRDCYTLASASADTHRLTVMGSKSQKTVYLIKFASAVSAGQFFNAFNELTRGDAFFASPTKKSSANSSSNGFAAWWKGKLPSKLSLSRPCCFRHLTNLDSSYLALSQTSAIVASPEHRRMSQPVTPQITPDQRSQTMPRRASAGLAAPSTSPTSTTSSSAAPNNNIRSSLMSPLASSLPCRVSMTPLAACTPVAPTTLG